MTWEEKFEAMNGLAGRCALHMRSAGDWYVTTGAGVVGDGLYRSIIGDGTSPEEAVEDWWQVAVTNLATNRSLQTPDGNFRWGGFMWKKVAP
jgi:hypothetical protein